MPKIEYSLAPQKLNTYDVYIDDKLSTSEYFQVSRIPPQFGGGRNSFVIYGSPYLKNNSKVLVEILDATGQPIYNRFIPGYVEANGKIVSVEIYDSTPAGIATIIILGKAAFTATGEPIPEFWQDKYNVRWTRNVLVNPSVYTTSPILFSTQPEAIVQEKRFVNVLSASYDSYLTEMPVNLTPLYDSAIHVGYGINAVSPNTFSSEHFTGIFTGSIKINQNTTIINLPITNIIDSSKATTYGYLIQSPLDDTKKLNSIFLKSGSYTSSIYGVTYPVTSSAKLQYFKLNENLVKVPISYANLRIFNINTVSGELYKIRVYSRAVTSRAEYKLIGDVPVNTTEILTSESVLGRTPIGDFYKTPNISDNWYAGILAQNVGIRSAIYPVSGSLSYYDSSNLTGNFVLYSSSQNLLDSIHAGIPIDTSTKKFANSVSQSGYFIGNKQNVSVYATTEYTLQFNAIYNSQTSSIELQGKPARVDIYLVGTTGISAVYNPLGQKIGEIVPTSKIALYQNKQFNFVPEVNTVGSVGIRFVVQNGAWDFSNISLKPASSTRFSPDEFELLIPNKDYFNEVLEYKVEFFDINNNSSDISATARPVFFTGSGIDLGTLP